MSASYPGTWVMCQAGDPAPMGAVSAPDQWGSYVCLWREKDFTLGRGKANLHGHGMDAWFPYGGLEHAASQQGIRFQVLVDDGKTPGLYSWIEVGKWEGEKATSDYEPLVVNGYSPIVIKNNLGKGTVQYLQGWTCYGGAETNHDQWSVQRSLVLCRLRPGRGQSHVKPKDWREIQVNYPGRVTQQQIRNLCLQKTNQRLSNPTDVPRSISIDLTYRREEGQRWTPNNAAESTDLDTVIKSEAVVRQLAEADYSVGRALFGAPLDTIQFSSERLQRTYTVPPRTDMFVDVTVFKQVCELNCQAKETIYNREGRIIMTRSVAGRWYAVTTSEIKVEITEKIAMKK